jgi:hypothetical protein
MTPDFMKPVIEWWALVGAALGVLGLWAKLAKEKRKVWLLSDFFDRLMPGESKTRYLIELTLFIGIGAFTSVAAVQPNSFVAAITAGMGWAGLVSSKA